MPYFPEKPEGYVPETFYNLTPGKCDGIYKCVTWDEKSTAENLEDSLYEFNPDYTDTVSLPTSFQNISMSEPTIEEVERFINTRYDITVGEISKDEYEMAMDEVYALYSYLDPKGNPVAMVGRDTARDYVINSALDAFEGGRDPNSTIQIFQSYVPQSDKPTPPEIVYSTNCVCGSGNWNCACALVIVILCLI